METLYGGKMTYREFLDKETPKEGGCMVCLATYKHTEYSSVRHEDIPMEKKRFLLIERHKCSNGFIFTVNGDMYYDYENMWKERITDWEILYKKEL